MKCTQNVQKHLTIHHIYMVLYICPFLALMLFQSFLCTAQTKKHSCASLNVMVLFQSSDAGTYPDCIIWLCTRYTLIQHCRENTKDPEQAEEDTTGWIMCKTVAILVSDCILPARQQIPWFCHFLINFGVTFHLCASRNSASSSNVGRQATLKGARLLSA